MRDIVVRPLGTDYAALAAWIGEDPEELRRAIEDRHEAPRDHWVAWAGDSVVGALHPWRGPDGRLRLFFDRCRADAYAPLVAQVEGPCLATVAGDDAEAGTALTGLGFVAGRVELDYDLPVAAHDVAVPAGYSLVSAADVPIEDVMALDCRLRDDVPGTDGWAADLQWFVEENHGSSYFDPDTYLIARSGGAEVGLVRVWNGPRPLPRLGLVGVLPEHRGRGLATAMLARVLSVWAARGGTVVTAEVDQDNAPSRALMKRYGGRVTGSSIEYVRLA
ncbi:MAG TPA: GNAT family N-acetyltransferase [Nocardioides sp.]